MGILELSIFNIIVIGHNAFKIKFKSVEVIHKIVAAG